MSQPDTMDEVDPMDEGISQTATAFQIAATNGDPALTIEEASTPLSTTQPATSSALLLSAETPPLVQPQPTLPASGTASTSHQQLPPHPGTSPSPRPARTGTPMRNTTGNNGEAASSRAASLHPPDPGFIMPTEAAPHGAPTRQYLNTKVTGVLLEGMKIIAKEQPKDPLRVLGEFLLQRSRELEAAVVTQI